jgi:hypothetical protein
MVNPKLPITLQSKTKITSLPRGISFSFTVTYHDNLGRSFDATNASPKLRPNRYNIAQLSSGLDNSTFNAQVVQAGRAAVKVFDSSNPSLKDFLILPVGEAIDPKLVSENIMLKSVISSHS